MNVHNFNISYQTYEHINELSVEDKLLCMRAEDALKTSYSPYSKFKVGTAIQLADGEIVLGSNQENVAYPSGLCAERVAFFAIGSSKPNAVVKAMAITAFTESFDIKNPVTSCGACLQVMAEFEQKQKSPITVIFYCLNGQIMKVEGIRSLLPFVFVEDRLAGIT
ncbi:cytidine deaminase [Pedobacter chitinilyticus]|uniref:Cytidine deaminase n=1 Tax=Pedobacter chitinilyticus TaxID=2233776 RepID=A0A3S3PCC3_9SPHI|nr:cytidine deaminase [Pedobacter chitinilyticus]RWU08418.1 cytidine deaminase [Pedobacter chitinilyticus]